MMRILALAALCMSTFIACTQNSTSKEILFVCTHGAARSPIAAAYFNQLAAENNLNFHAVFKGTEPDQELTTETISGLSKDGFDITNWKPKKVSAQDIEKAYKIVTFDCSVSDQKQSSLTEEWNGTPSISQDYTIARDAIKNHVEQLVTRLKNE